jgi:hypothetical protein
MRCSLLDNSALFFHSSTGRLIASIRGAFSLDKYIRLTGSSISIYRKFLKEGVALFSIPAQVAM